MKPILRNFCFALLGFVFFFTAVSGNAQVLTDITPTNLISFQYDYSTFYPDHNLVYGTTIEIGTNGVGGIFSMNLDGSGFSNLYNFSYPLLDTNTSFYTNNDGGTPQASVILYSNKLFGTASFGGAYGFGTIFSINPDGSGFTTLHSLSLADGTFPAAKLVATNGVLFGITSGGNPDVGYRYAHQHCTIFRMNLDGTGFSVLHDFMTAYNLSSLTLYGNQLIGTTSEGGDSGYGSIFTMNLDGTSFTNLHSFNGVDGSDVFGPLAVSSNIFYGATQSDGNGVGTIFSLHTDGTHFQTLHEMPTSNNGTREYIVNGGSSLVLAEGHLYGTQQKNPGIYDGGWIFGTGIELPTEQLFSINIDGSGYKVLDDFGQNAFFPADLTFSNESLFFSYYNGLAKYQLHPDFFSGEAALADYVFYLKFPNNNEFGYYNYNFFPCIYHYNLGFEYFIDAGDGASGAYLYDFTSGHFWYTSPTLYPYIFDFTRNTWLYYYNTTNPRFFFDFTIERKIFE